jgi:hypothetical protein
MTSENPDLAVVHKVPNGRAKEIERIRTEGDYVDTGVTRVTDFTE